MYICYLIAYCWCLCFRSPREPTCIYLVLAWMSFSLSPCASLSCTFISMYYVDTACHLLDWCCPFDVSLILFTAAFRACGTRFEPSRQNHLEVCHKECLAATNFGLCETNTNANHTKHATASPVIGLRRVDTELKSQSFKSRRSSFPLINFASMLHLDKHPYFRTARRLSPVRIGTRGIRCGACWSRSCRLLLCRVSLHWQKLIYQKWHHVMGLWWIEPTSNSQNV